MSEFLEIFDFDTIFSSHKEYENWKSNIKDRLGVDYSQRKTKVILKVGDKELETTLGRVFLNLLLMKPFAIAGMKVTVDDLFQEETVTQGSLDQYFNHILKHFKAVSGETIDYDAIREMLIQSMNEMCDLSGEYNVKVGNSISFRDLVRLECEDPEAERLFAPEVKGGSYDEIELQFKEESKKLINYFKSKKDSELHPFVESESGVNNKQFEQCLGFVGLKPDIYGNVIPVTIKDNFLHGLQTLETYYINSLGTRLALMTNKKYTKSSGYLTRKLSLSNIDRYHNASICDCGTTHFVIYNVNCKEKLSQIIGRHYYDIDDSGKKISDELHTVTEDSVDLIGKKIGLRSPVTCACGDGHVCATCYGRELAEINKDINTGLSATLRLTEPLTQKLLSAKHLLSTNTDKIDWGENFSDVFSINMDSIYFLPDVDASITFDKPTSEDFDEDEDAYFTQKIEILLEGSKKPIEYNSPVRLYINDIFLTTEKMKDDDTTITLSTKTVDENTHLFKYHAKNNALTHSLQEILDLIETSDHLGITDYSEFVNKFDDLLIENDMNSINSVHIEMIASNLIRDASDIRKHLDFSKKKLDDYKIIRVSTSVMNGPLAVSLAFERLNDQFIDLNTYTKTDVSMMDNLYK